MTTQLPERLRALADDAPTALSAGNLWRVGTRRHRRRVADLADRWPAAWWWPRPSLGLGDWRSRRPRARRATATNGGSMAIPERFFHPSPWLSSDVESRTAGRAVSAPRGTTSRSGRTSMHEVACRPVRRPTTSSTCPEWLPTTTSSCRRTAGMSRTSWTDNLVGTRGWVTARSWASRSWT